MIASSTTTPTASALTAVLGLVIALLVTAPASAQPIGAFDGDPATTERIDTDDPAAAALLVSRTRFDDAGGDGRSAVHAVVATTATFADSLAGAALTGDGPLLLTPPDALDGAVADELDRILPDGATVYVLGGEDALSSSVVDGIVALGLTPLRLEGPTRIETALAVADEARRLTPSTTVLLARSEGADGNPTSAWADSMTGGALAAAARLPIIVTPSSATHPAVAAWLAANAPLDVVVLGGEAAIAAAVADAVGASTRLAGPERTATAAQIAASRLWPRGDDRRFVILDGGRADGWAFGLSAAGLAADAGAPPLLVVGGITASTRREVSTCGPADVDLVLVGSGAVIGQDLEADLTRLDGQACAAQFTRLTEFASCQAILDHFITEGLARVGPYGLDGYWWGAPVAEPAPAGEPQPVPAPEEPAAGADRPESDDAAAIEESDGVSGTNTQEVDVDEPDVVKTNGEAAYVVRFGGIEVVDVATDTPPAHVRTLEVPAGGSGTELLLDGDVLLALSRHQGPIPVEDDAPSGTAFAPEGYYPQPRTHLARYDLSDPTDPQLIDATTIDGDYRSARMVDGIARVVLSANPSGLPFVFPSDGSQEAHEAALAHNRDVIATSTLQDWLPAVGEDGQPLLACGDVFAPPTFSGISTIAVTTIDVGESVQPTASAAVIASGETTYASTERLVVSSTQWGQWNDTAAEADGVTTELHSFDIADPADLRYVASGRVDGFALSAFAISERDGYYRIATTTEPPWIPIPEPVPVEDGPAFAQQDTTDNGITVLTEGGGELFEVGRVFGLGLGERIFAVRFLGDIAAVVTFRQVDPLFLVDLTNPAAPRVTGELKIPGVSTYLHPVGPDHLLGVGRDGTEDGRLTNLQVSLFDIADHADPQRVDTIDFADNAFSPAEQDYKAFLFWSPLNRAVLPVSDYSDGYTSTAAAIDVDTAADALTLAGQAAHRDDGERPDEVTRTFIAHGTLYTVSHGGVGAADLVTLEPIGFAEFPGGGECCVTIDEDGAPPPE